MYAHHSHPSREQGVRTQTHAFGSRFLLSKRVRRQKHRIVINSNCKITGTSDEITLLDYGETFVLGTIGARLKLCVILPCVDCRAGAGNIRSIKNGIKKLGYSVREVCCDREGFREQAGSATEVHSCLCRS